MRYFETIKTISFCRLLLLLFAPLLLPSCVEIEEEFWINADSSGNAQVTAKISTLLYQRLPNRSTLAENAQKAAEDTPGVVLTSFATSTEGIETLLTGSITFEDARQIQSFVTRFLELQEIIEEGDEMVKPVQLFVRFPNLHFHCTIGLKEIAREQNIPKFALSLLSEKDRIRHIMHLPSAVTSHNATHISEDRKTLQWDLPLSDLLQNDAELTFVSPLPYLWPSLIISVLLLLFLLVLILRRLSRKRRHRTAHSQPTPSSQPNPEP